VTDVAFFLEKSVDLLRERVGAYECGYERIDWMSHDELEVALGVSGTLMETITDHLRNISDIQESELSGAPIFVVKGRGKRSWRCQLRLLLHSRMRVISLLAVLTSGIGAVGYWRWKKRKREEALKRCAGFLVDKLKVSRVEMDERKMQRLCTHYMCANGIDWPDVCKLVRRCPYVEASPRGNDIGFRYRR
jgi:hypothetical protein